jgi:uncharacterized protein
MAEAALSTAPREETPTPWWRVGMVWLVVGGPLAVVVAALVTAAIAVDGAEEVLTRPKPVSSAAEAPQLPAMQGRNHAATPKN